MQSQHPLAQYHCLALPLRLLCVPILALFASSTTAETIHVPREHQAIQAAINEAQAGDIVLVEAGTYEESLRLKPGVTLMSAGDETRGKKGLKRAETTVIDGRGKVGKGAGVQMAENSTLDGFTITNVGLYDDVAWKRHHATQGEQQGYEEIGEPGRTGVSIIGVTCTVRNNIVHHNGNTGIGILGMPDRPTTPLVIHNTCYRNMGGGIGSMKGSTAVIRSNTCFENFYAGIGHSASSPLVVDNDCYDNVRGGIGISEGSSPIVRRNRCFHNRRAGIGIRTGNDTKPLIEDNDCYENDMAGIGIREEAAPIIRGNRSHHNKMTGIGSRTKASPIIIGNEVYENTLSGIGQQSGATTILIENFCHHNKTSGIGFATCESGRSTLLNNRVIDNAKVAVGINSGWKVNLRGNVLSRQGGLPPIVMVSAGAEASFSNNTIQGGGVAGIRTSGVVRADNNQFKGTAFRRVGPPNFAVWALEGSHVELTGNTFQSWRNALLATKSDVSVIGNKVSNFHRAAFVVKNSTSPADVVGNIATSEDSGNKVVSLTGSTGVVANNKIVPVPTTEAAPLRDNEQSTP